MHKIFGDLQKKKKKSIFLASPSLHKYAWNELCGKMKHVWFLLGTVYLKRHEPVWEMWVSAVFSSNFCASHAVYFNLIQGLFRASVSCLVAPSEEYVETKGYGLWIFGNISWEMSGTYLFCRHQVLFNISQLLVQASVCLSVSWCPSKHVYPSTLWLSGLW